MSLQVDTSPSFSSLETQSRGQWTRKLGTGLIANVLLLGLVLGVKVPSGETQLVPSRVQIISFNHLTALPRLPVMAKPTVVPGMRTTPKARLFEATRPSIVHNLDLPLPPSVTPTKVEVKIALPAIEAPSLPAPKPIVGSFASTSPPPARPEREPVRVSTGGFGNSVLSLERRPSPKLVAAGSFGEEETQMGAKPGTRAGLAQRSGFENLEVVHSGKVKMEVVQGEAFEGTGPSAPKLRSSAKMMPSVFDASPSSSSRNRVEREKRETEFKGVEILSKPRPQYTEDARRLGIEGEVHLRILFGADGRIKVLAIVRGLGHGLDENAAIAAAQIRFRPASNEGQAVEQAAVVRVQFQLAN